MHWSYSDRPAHPDAAPVSADCREGVGTCLRRMRRRAREHGSAQLSAWRDIAGGSPVGEQLGKSGLGLIGEDLGGVFSEWFQGVMSYCGVLCWCGADEYGEDP